MKCVICKQGETRPGKTTITLERDQTMLVFRDVPAEVCGNCDEAYVDEKIADKLLTIGNQAVQAGVQVDIRKFQVPTGV